MLKNKAKQAAQVSGAKAVNNLGQSAKQAISGVGNKTYTVTLSNIPANLAELQAMPEGTLKQPEHTAAFTVAALCMYPADKDACFEMLNYLHGPRGLNPSDRRFIADCSDIRIMLPVHILREQFILSDIRPPKSADPWV